MKTFLLLFLTLLLHVNISAVNNCSRYCVIHLSTLYYRFNNNLLDLNPQYCTHIVLDAYEDNELDYDILSKAFRSLKTSTPFLAEVKILTLLKCNELTLLSIHQLIERFKKFDGFYFNWREEKYISKEFFQMETIKEKHQFLSSTLINFRKIFNNKLIVTTVGPKYAFQGYYDFKTFNETVDYFALDTEQYLLHLHMQNWFPAKQRIGNNATMENLANILLDNGIPKNKLLIYVDGPKYVEEPRIRIIWSSLNNFNGVLIDNIQKFNNELFKANIMNDDITKLEKLHLCPSVDVAPKKNINKLACYYSLKDDESYDFIAKEKYQKCDRIIFHKLTSNYSNEISAENLHKVIQYFQNLNLPQTALILSFEIDYNNTRQLWNDVDSFETFSEITALNINDFVENYGLDGIELICDESLTAENIEEIILKIKSTCSKNIEIGLQVDVFKSSKLVDVMNKVEWVTHKINPLSDAALAIFYHWNDLYEKHELDLKKVIIKFSPAIWQQDAIFSFPGKRDTKEEENPEDDIILNRKYLCLNETIKKNLPAADSYLNLPIIFSIQEDSEESKEKMLKNIDDPHLQMAVIQFEVFGGSLPRDVYYLRYETKEIIEYKIKIAQRYGFGGFAIASINDDDVEGICGTSLFEDLVKIIK